MWFHVIVRILLGGINPIPNQADVENIAKNLCVTYELEDNLVDDENSFLFRITFHNTGNETLTYGNYSIYMYNIRLLQPIQSPYPNGYKLHDCSLWLHHVSGSLYRQGNNSYRMKYENFYVRVLRIHIIYMYTFQSVFILD